MAYTTYTSANLGSKPKFTKAVADRNLMFMSEAERLKYWRVKGLKPQEMKKKGNPKAKMLDEKSVREIRRLCAEGKLIAREIGAMFGVSRATVSAIKHGRLWKKYE